MTTKLYETDFSQWAVAQADHLRNEEYAELDLLNLIEEIEDMAARHRAELHNRLVRIIAHLLKMACEPNSRAMRSWKEEVLAYRDDLNHMLESNATLRKTADTYIADAYQPARRQAAAGTACSVEDFPTECPWTIQQLLDEDFWPG